MKTFQVACDPWGVSVERVEASRIFFSFKNSQFFLLSQHSISIQSTMMMLRVRKENLTN